LTAPGALEMHFQPIVMLATGRVIAHEALARFPEHPGVPIPDLFHAAHAAGFGPELESLAVTRALAAPDRPRWTVLTVNLSVSTLRSERLWEALPADLAGIVVEVTEDELWGYGEELDRALARLQAAGARVALDDAGAGYSGLQQLMRVRPDIVKLDRSLVCGVATDPARAALVAAFASFATQTGGAVCAEGIECPDDLRTIAELDVAYAQGYLLGRPSRAFAPPAPVAAAGLASALRGGLRGLEPVARDLTTSLGGSVPERLATLIGAAAGADRVDLWRLDRRAGDLIAVRVPDSEPGARVALGDVPVRAHALATGEAGQVLRTDVDADAVERRALAAAGYQGVLLVPVEDGGMVLGLVACYRRRARPFSREAVVGVRARALPFVSVLSGGAGLTAAAEPA
jgi:EAL domain-containing protein (putative c-di-GMP-specific phosphodiesterase class I)